MLSRRNFASVSFSLLALLGGCDRPASTPTLPPAESSTSIPAERASLPNAAPRAVAAPSAKPLSAGDALRTLEGLGNAEEQARTAAQMASSMSVEQVRVWIGELINAPPSASRDALLLAALQKLAETSPSEALQMAMSLEPATAEKIARKVAEVWAKSDHQAVYLRAMSLPQGPMRDQLQAVAVRFWSEQNPAEAFQAMAELPYGDGGVLIWMAARKLSQQNMEQAFQMLDLIQDPQVWDTAAGRVFETFALKDPKGATEMLLDQTDANVGVPLGYALGGYFASNSVPEGMAILNQIGNDRVADHFIHGMIHRLNKKDMTPLMENLASLENTTHRQILAEGVARDLSKVNPDGATAWIPNIADEEARARAYQGVGQGYAERDSQATEQWLQTLPPGKDRRYAIFGYATQNAAINPQQSANWALQIPEQDIRERLLRTVLSSWRWRNQEQAQSWAASAGYSHLMLQRPTN